MIEWITVQLHARQSQDIFALQITYAAYVEIGYWIREKIVTLSLTAPHYVNLRQATNVKTTHALLLVSVEMVKFTQEKIVIQFLTVLIYAKHKLGTHVPITIVLIAEIIFYK